MLPDATAHRLQNMMNHIHNQLVPLQSEYVWLQQQMLALRAEQAYFISRIPLGDFVLAAIQITWGCNSGGSGGFSGWNVLTRELFEVYSKLDDMVTLSHPEKGESLTVRVSDLFGTYCQVFRHDAFALYFYNQQGRSWGFPFVAEVERQVQVVHKGRWSKNPSGGALLVMPTPPTLPAPPIQQA